MNSEVVSVELYDMCSECLDVISCTIAPAHRRIRVVVCIALHMQVVFHKSHLEKLCRKCKVDAWFATSAKTGANVELAIKEVSVLNLTTCTQKVLCLVSVQLKERRLNTAIPIFVI